MTTYWWLIGVQYDLIAYRGTDVAAPITLRSGASKVMRSTPTDFPLRPPSTVTPEKSINITWLVQHFENDAKFRIDRSGPDCRTPRRNADVNGALSFLGELQSFCANVVGYFRDTVFPMDPNAGLDLSCLTDKEVCIDWLIDCQCRLLVVRSLCPWFPSLRRSDRTVLSWIPTSSQRCSRRRCAPSK